MFNPKRIKINFYSAETKKADVALKNLKKKYKNYPINKADVIVALGGDGTILSALHKSIKLSKPIFGINRGEYGFLTNPHKNIDLIKRLEKAKKTEMHVLKMIATKKDGKKKEAMAFNEVSLLRSSGHAAKIKVQVDNIVRIKELVCDGILLATPAGSTAYNLSARGQIIPMNSKLLALTPISPFRPRSWRGALINSKSKVTFIILDEKKRSVNVSADFREIKDIKKVEIIEDRTFKLSLLFDPDHQFDKKVLKEQFSF
ncbi:MAG: NAD kinase [Alphaproteobacteria bacterium MarineAlpha6_Bin3]|nr:MAG: NAD kinase [Alphaproteobacteria bacterium MarineAlpha6_Bin3]|tara:strand:- start:12498 stop:13274 length:777 start_codon:yes stop_codon:yes gene_type:complete